MVQVHCRKNAEIVMGSVIGLEIEKQQSMKIEIVPTVTSELWRVLQYEV